MIKKLTNNIGWKIFSFILAFFFWLAVVNAEDPTITRKFENVPVDKISEEVITSQRQSVSTETAIRTMETNIIGKSIDYVSGETVDVTVKGSRSIIEDMTIEDIYAYADMVNLSITNAIDIEIELEDSIELVAVKPANMLIELEDVISVQKEVQYYFEGEPMTDYIALEPEITPNIIQITGPDSNISQISSVIVPIKIEGASKDVTLLGDPQVLDSDNNEIDELETNIGEVEILVPIEKTKEVPIKLIQFDAVPEGYELMSFNLDDSSVMLRGDAELIDDITQISINSISLETMTNDITVTVDLEEFLPEGVNIYNDSTEVNIRFIIEDILSKEISVEPSDLIVKNLPEGMQFSFIESEPILISIEGVFEAIDEVDIDSIAPYISLEDLEEGTHEIRVEYYIPDSVEDISGEQYITILLEEEVTPEEDLLEEVPDEIIDNAIN